MTNICELLQRTSLGILEQFPYTHKEQEVPETLHHSGASHSPWLAGVRMLKLSSFGLRWDNSELELTLQTPSRIRLRLGLCQKSHRYLASSLLILLRLPLTNFSWEHVLNKSLAHESLS